LQSNKRVLELERHTYLSNVKALKTLENVETCWISMISFVKKMIARYKALHHADVRKLACM